MPIGGLLGIGLGMAENAINNNQQQENMDIQFRNQKALNEQGLKNSKEIWDYTNYENQVKHIKNSGLNVGLMYNGQGQGGSTNAGSGGSAASASAIPMDLASKARVGLEAEALQSQINLNNANAEKAKADAVNTGEKTTTEINSRDIMIESMKQSGIAEWYENIKTQMMREGYDGEDAVTNFSNKVFGKNDVQGYRETSPEIVKFQQDLFKSAAEVKNLDANALLTNEKAKGYWAELLNATKNADSNEINALANKLASEWTTGEFTNWKTWAELGMKAVQTVGSLIKGGTKINSNSTYNQNGNRINDINH